MEIIIRKMVWDSLWKDILMDGKMMTKKGEVLGPNND